MEPILLTLKPYGKSYEMESHQGEEFGYVLKGNVTLVRDNKKYKLKAKDTFYMNGKKNHYLYNHTNSEAVILWITTPPMFSQISLMNISLKYFFKALGIETQQILK